MSIRPKFLPSVLLSVLFTLSVMQLVQTIPVSPQEAMAEPQPFKVQSKRGYTPHPAGPGSGAIFNKDWPS
ncbi:hypothetical protein BG004_002072, partial [Podila humilis]